MQRPHARQLRPAFLTGNGGARPSAGRACAEALHTAPRLKMAAAGCAQRGFARTGTWSREQRACVRPGGTPPPPGSKAALPTTFWGEYVLRARVSPFFAPRIKLSFASEPNSVSVSFYWLNGHWTERTLVGDRFRRVIVRSSA